MKAWRLQRSGTFLEVFDIDDVTRQVKKVTTLKMKVPMTHYEASDYMRLHYPIKEVANEVP
jgi:hypothetical protein